MAILTKGVQTKSYEEILMNKIETKEAVIGVIGMGYVGLPNMVSKANAGYSVIGFDVDTNKVQSINDGVSYITDVKDHQLINLVEQFKLRATNDYSELALADIIMVCVPTPIDDYKQPDLSFVDSATSSIAAYAKEGALAILEIRPDS